jgi:hypothetical protein
MFLVLFWPTAAECAQVQCSEWSSTGAGQLFSGKQVIKGTNMDKQP